MSERLNRLLEYEKRLMQDREQLMELMREHSQEDGQLVEYKLQCFQQELAFLNQQLEMMKADARRHPATSAERPQGVQSGVGQPQPVQIQSGMEQPRGTQPGMQQAQVQPTAQSAFNSQLSQSAIKLQQTATQRMNAGMEQVRAAGGRANDYVKKDLEKTIGRSLMGIFASVLIFISLILFATLLLPYFNDTAKMITTYVVSFAFLGIGLWRLHKDRENKFYLALTGCGVGALYISLLLSNMYFKVLGDIPLYVLICIWGIGVCFLAKQQSKLFQVIGELGITISILFGCILCGIKEDVGKYIPLLIFYGISSAVFYVVHFEKEFYKNLLHHIFNVINVLILLVTSFALLEDGAEYILLFVITGLSFASIFFHRMEKESLSFGIIAPIYLFMTYTALSYILGEAELFGILLYLSTVLLMLWSEYRNMPHKEGKYIFQGFLMLMAMLGLNYHEGLYNYGMVFVAILPVLIGGFLRNNIVMKYGSLIMLWIYMADALKINDTLRFFLGFLTLCVAFFLLWWKKEQYSRIYKYVLHVFTIIFLVAQMNDVVRDLIELLTGERRVYDIPRVCNYMCFTLFNIGMLKSVFGRNLRTGEAENPALYHIINAIAMCIGLFMIGDGYEGIWNIFLILTVLGAFFVNAKNLLDKRDNLFAGIYVGIKFAVLMIVILNSFDTVNYIVSIACLLMAIGAIVLGFVGQYKSLRVFGLVLSMISTFKLIMIDISYENTLGNAISFFVSGILCFVISLIYNYIDKKWKDSMSNEQEDAKRA
ncbi:MAG: DUF2339 domain-containing protein [Lachnospiraceae bacterium]|nr:DUF2339 domain-containing protein [Lachnospiraceae bacterium]